MAAVTAPVLQTPFIHRPTSVSVVICADSLDQWDDLDRALAALHGQTRRAEQVVIVVDHHDQLLEWAADAWSMQGVDGEPVVNVIASTHARGQAGCRNSGVEWCHGDVIAFLDPGALTADRHWIETMIDDYAQSDVAGVGGGACADWGLEDAPRWLPAEFGWAIGCTHPGLPSDVGEVESLFSGNMSFRREVFAEVGGFDACPAPSDELCVRIRRRFPLARLLHDPDLEVVHRMRGDERSFAGYRRRCFEEGRSSASIARAVGRDRDLVPTRPFSATGAPRGVVRGVRDGLGGHPAGFQQAGALVVGVAWAAAGYVRGRISPRV